MQSKLLDEDLEISKEYLLNVKHEPLQKRESFDVDFEIIALFDVSESRNDGNTLVMHALFGVFVDRRTTKQIINEFYKINGVGFALSKVMADFFSIRHYLPFVFLYVAYMPLRGGSRKNTDWIGIHKIVRYRQNKGYAYFITKNGLTIKMNFAKGNLENRLHDVCVLIEKNLEFMERILLAGLAEIKAPKETGLVLKFRNCDCHTHLKVKTDNDPEQITVLFMTFLIDHLGIESEYPEEEKIYYRQNLQRIKKLY